MPENLESGADEGCGGCSVGRGREVSTVGVRFHNLARSEHYLSDGFECEIGEEVIVDSEDGERYGTVCEATSRTRGGCGVGCMKRLHRKATSQDTEIFQKKVDREKEALALCRERVTERNLPMKLVMADQSFDGKKIVFYFTSEGRVDFRELVRDLAQRFHTRIEMRQIGPRDESGVKGGYGPCGRNLCCSSFLKEFAPISIRMAKDQNLSLNPSKISGMCGRLMCCLRYEHTSKDTLPHHESASP
ncbi:MAG TPA: regulatory iron-sulfur-containing complex subunit RicT [Candidatus Polarisedimenticolia bacterium]|nr:regulatory iron-sulfur-containing complex subunit RicT [Candidatus Polarisedimenticolia bacterium]